MKKTRFFVLMLAFMVAVAMLAGCASIMGKSKQTLNISSVPDGADITISNKEGKVILAGKTPTIVTLKAGAGFFKGEDYTVFFKKGSSTCHTRIGREIGGWYLAGNLPWVWIIAPIGWFIIDPATGAMWTLEKDINVDMSQPPLDGVCVRVKPKVEGIEKAGKDEK